MRFESDECSIENIAADDNLEVNIKIDLDECEKLAKEEILVDSLKQHLEHKTIYCKAKKYAMMRNESFPTNPDLAKARIVVVLEKSPVKVAKALLDFLSLLKSIIGFLK